ncbi:helix-turn-helix domain-containing protein [Methylobacterium nodulans]|uniref:DUF433 domain-containing protein n=1 Tax=Methylobacterium nodulans (strain LMG 21967 / CNCM I-2342 / ORS 2060) TaxID=460265 RepID=B8IW92_METNO|nr:helix-turn-helix domain-containing protein [Methylobacterium nodulans]ACL62682.1 conserved hypothetical protein [Methylobacterium nodulans ORS 2060]
MLHQRTSSHAPEAPPLGIGYYTVPEAARLLRMPARNINRWLGGYSFKSGGKPGQMPPLWTPELPVTEDDRLELGFRDLIELRFVNAFVKEGLDLRVIRSCLDYARKCVQDDRPFSTPRFRTDGRTIFLESLKASEASEFLDLKQGQYVIKAVMERTFRDLDIDDDVVARWRPFHGKDSIVIDPQRAFGQPIAADYGVSTIALAEAVKAEGSVDRVARLYEVAPSVVRGAVKFEESLLAA